MAQGFILWNKKGYVSETSFLDLAALTMKNKNGRNKRGLLMRGMLPSNCTGQDTDEIFQLTFISPRAVTLHEISVNQKLR